MMPLLSLSFIALSFLLYFVFAMVAEVWFVKMRCEDEKPSKHQSLFHHFLFHFFPYDFSSRQNDDGERRKGRRAVSIPIRAVSILIHRRGNAPFLSSRAPPWKLIKPGSASSEVRLHTQRRSTRPWRSSSLTSSKDGWPPDIAPSGQTTTTDVENFLGPCSSTRMEMRTAPYQISIVNHCYSFTSNYVDSPRKEINNEGVDPKAF